MRRREFIASQRTRLDAEIHRLFPRTYVPHGKMRLNDDVRDELVRTVQTLKTLVMSFGAKDPDELAKRNVDGRNAPPIR